MPAIRRRYHYANIIMSPAIFGQTNVLCGQTVELFLDNKDSINTPFLGFASWNSTESDSFCLIKSIVGFTMEEAPFVGNWIEYNKNDLMLGVKSDQGVKVVVKNEALVVVARLNEVSERSDNSVVSLFDRK